MYPLIYIIQDVHYLIYQHFSGKDVLCLLEVSKFCSEAVLNSNCMRKIKLVMKFEDKDAGAIEEAINILKKTKRNYQFIDIDCEFHPRLSRELREFLKRAGQFVVELIFKSFIDDLLPEFHLPKLQVLELANINFHGQYSILTKTSSVKKLKLKMRKLSENLNAPKPTKKSIECLRKFIINNRQLEDLEIRGAFHCYTFFSQDLSKEASFNLKTLKVIDIPSSLEQTNLIKIIASQANSLNSVSIDTSVPNVIKHVFNNLPNLTSLDLRIGPNFNIRDLSLMFNERIVDLKIQSQTYVFRYHVDISELLSLMPNLSSLFIENLNKVQTEYIVQNTKHLRTLSYRSKSENDWASTFYNELKLKFPEANQNMSINMFPKRY